jgi:NAD(P)-dependent dehydrogenase (short-subunit alcohol dehydrogenase family)
LLKNKIVLITGATGALGRVVTKMLLEKGAEVISLYRTEDRFGELESFVEDFRYALTGLKGDVISEHSVKAVVRKTIEKAGRIDILLNIVGTYLGGKTVVETEESLWDFMMDVNLKSVFLCCKAVLPKMIERNYGKIVNVSARTAVEKRRRRSGAYAVSKAGVKVLTETVAEEVKRYNINVNCVMPSTINTQANRENFPKADFSKWVAPEDIARVILFLISDSSNTISGASIPVYGNA